MKNKALRAILFFLYGFLLQVCIGYFVRSNQYPDYIEIPAECLAFLTAGYIIQRFEKKIFPNVAAFLTPALGVLIVAGLLEQTGRVDRIVDIIFCGVSFFLGYLSYKVSTQKFTYFTVFWALFCLLFVLKINPLIQYYTFNNSLENSGLLNKKVSYSLKKTDGSYIHSEELKDKVVLIDYWNQRCAPCLSKMKYLEKVANKLSGNPDFRLIIVNLGKPDSFDDFLNYSKKLSPALEYAYDTSSFLANRLKVEGIPTEFLFNKGGKLIDEFAGFGDDIAMIYVNKTVSKIKRLLNEK